MHTVAAQADGSWVLTVSLPRVVAASNAQVMVGDGTVEVDAKADGYFLSVSLPPKLDDNPRVVFSRRRRDLTLTFAPSDHAPQSSTRATSSPAFVKRPGHQGTAGWGPDGMDVWQQDNLAALAHTLGSNLHAIVDSFLPVALATAVGASVRKLARDGLLEPGEIEGGLKPKVRGDSMRWMKVTGLPPKEPTTEDALGLFAHRLDVAMAGLCSDMPSLQGVELLRDRAMVACYPGGGTGYARHIDGMKGGQNGSRVLTAILYLNPEWAPGHGGELLLHIGDGSGVGGSVAAGSGVAQRENTGPIEVAPLHNRLLIFYSDARCPHEVLPATLDRYAISFWYHDAVIVKGQS